jgi:transposase
VSLSKPAIDVTVGGMAKELVPDELWETIEPLLPPEPPKPKGGRPRVDNRAALSGIIFVLKSGIPWEMFPQEMGCGSGVTCWRRLREWQEAGVWERLHQVLLGGAKTGKNPTDKGKAGSKRHLVSDRRGIPLSVMLTAANVHDSMVFEELVDAIEPIKRPRGRPRKRPQKLHADKAYDDKKCKEALRRRSIKNRIARKGKESSEKLGRHRWIVERTLAWLSKYRRLTIRYERRDDIHEAFLHLGCSLICLNYLK